MNETMLKGLGKTFKPLIAPAANEGEKRLKIYLESIELKENETGAVVVVDFDQAGKAIIVVAAVSGREISRKITTIDKNQLIDFILKTI